MSEFEHSITINRDPEHVFSFIADLGQLPTYLTLIRKIEPQTGERVRVEGEIFGYRFNQAGFFKTDAKLRRIDFGSEGNELFRGWLQVKQGSDLSASDLTVHLDFGIPPAQEERLRLRVTNLDTMIQDGLIRTLESFKNACEGHGDPLNEADAAALA